MSLKRSIWKYSKMKKSEKPEFLRPQNLIDKSLIGQTVNWKKGSKLYSLTIKKGHLNYKLSHVYQ